MMILNEICNEWKILWIASWHKFVLQSLFVPYSFSIKHKYLTCWFYSKYHVYVNCTSHWSLKYNVSCVFSWVYLWVYCFKIRYTYSWSTNATHSWNLLINNLLCLWQKFHLKNKSISCFTKWTLNLLNNYFEINEIM